MQTKSLAESSRSHPKRLMDEVCSVLSRDEIGLTTQRDPLIIMLGESWLRRSIDNKVNRKNYASQHIRFMSKLLMDLRIRRPNQTKPYVNFLCQYILKQSLRQPSSAPCPTWMTLKTSDRLQMPSNINMISRGALISCGHTMQNLKIVTQVISKKCETFRHLVEFEWNERLTRLARCVLASRKVFSEEKLPSQQDIQTLNKSLDYMLASLEAQRLV